MTHWTTCAWFTVEDAARILRVRRNTLYDACASGDFPCMRFGGTGDSWFIRIPCEALRMRVLPGSPSRTYSTPDDAAQLELDLDPTCLIPVRRFRNTREVIKAWDWERRTFRNLKES